MRSGGTGIHQDKGFPDVGRHPPQGLQVRDIDWKHWTPAERATLLFVVRDGQVLLIRKKRGLGAGKINGPGGRRDAGETALACAVREVQEELLVTPVGVSLAGRLRFQFVDGFSIHVDVFKARDCQGQPQETVEAVPLWTAVDAIPYGEMWADDHLWVPLMLSDTGFDGRFIFDGDTLLDHAIETDVGAADGPTSRPAANLRDNP
jgi:8-oxo-dGTP diphosphatase